jgi:Na+-driven multidrug efflux pump
MMGLNLFGLALKVPLNLIFVFGEFGLPAMGATGCALSTTIVSWIICAGAWRGAAFRRPTIATPSSRIGHGRDGATSVT